MSHRILRQGKAMDIGYQIYHADQPYTSSAYRDLGGSGSPLPVRLHRRPNRCSTPLTGSRPGHSNGQSGSLDGLSRDDAGCTAWVLSGRMNVSDGRRSSCERHDPRTCRQRSASPSDALDSCQEFDVECRRRGHHAPLNRSVDVDHHGRQRPSDAMIPTRSHVYPTAARPPGTPLHLWNSSEHERQHGHSSPEIHFDYLRHKNNYNSSSSRSEIPRYGAYDYSELPNGHANDSLLDGADMRSSVCSSLRESDRSDVFGSGSPAESNNNNNNSKSRSCGVSPASLSWLDVPATVSPPRLEAHQLSLSRASVPTTSKTPRRSESTSSSSSSSSTPNIIRRHLRTIAHTLDVRLSALSSGRSPAHARPASRYGPGESTHGGKPTLTRSNSEPEALDRVSSVQRISAGDDDYGFSCSYPLSRLRALHDQRDSVPPSPSSLVGRSLADSGCGRRSTVDDAVTPSSRVSTTTDSESSRSTTKVTLTPTSGRCSSSSLLLFKDHHRPSPLKVG